MDRTINQRLDQFLKEKHISQEELRLKLGLTNRQQVNSWIKCHSNIPDKHILKILLEYPELNANWFLHNIGAPLNDQKVLRQVARNDYGFCEDCAEKNLRIEFLEGEKQKLKEKLMKTYIEFGSLQEKVTRYQKLLKSLKINEEN